MLCTSVTVGGGTVVKELVTNLTDNEALIQAAVFVGVSDMCTQYTFIEKYQEDSNWVFKFEINKTCDVVALGFSGLTKFISNNFTAITALLITAGIVTIIWMWRDVETKQIEADVKLVETTENEITEVLNNPDLTAEQKAALIELILQNIPGTDDGTDYTSTIILVAAVLGAAYVLGRGR